MAAQTPDHRITINHSETLQSSPNSLQPPRSISRSRGASHLAVHLCFSCRFPVAFWISPDVFLVTSAEKIHLDKVVFTVFFFFFPTQQWASPVPWVTEEVFISGGAEDSLLLNGGAHPCKHAKPPGNVWFPKGDRAPPNLYVFAGKCIPLCQVWGTYEK